MNATSRPAARGYDAIDQRPLVQSRQDLPGEVPGNDRVRRCIREISAIGSLRVKVRPDGLDTPYAASSIPPAIIRHVVRLYLRFTLSYRDVEDLLAERGLDVSYESVRRWVKKFGPMFARKLRQRRPDRARMASRRNGGSDRRQALLALARRRQ